MESLALTLCQRKLGLRKGKHSQAKSTPLVPSAWFPDVHCGFLATVPPFHIKVPPVAKKQKANCQEMQDNTEVEERHTPIVVRHPADNDSPGALADGRKASWCHSDTHRQ